MAVPKSKTSRANKHSRKSNWKLSAPSMIKCPKCQALILPHRVCGECGYYKGMEVIKKEA